MRGPDDVVEIVYSPESIDWDRPGVSHYRVAFPLDGKWGYSLVPVTVVNGRLGSSQDNVLIVGGTHGNEWEGQIAVRRLAAELDPDQMRGRVILIPQLSPSACAANSRWSPLDGVNMNRAFPGDPDGTISYRIAHFVLSAVFPQVRVVIDVHSGGRDTCFPFVASFHPVHDAAQRAEMATVAALFRTPFVMIYSSEMASGLLTEEAEKLGKIAIGTEVGFGESVDAKGVSCAIGGAISTLHHYGMLSTLPDDLAVPPEERPRFVEAASLSGYIPSPRDGIWEPRIRPGTDVRKGDLIGLVHEVAAHVSAPIEVRAPDDGTVLMMRYAALTETGDTLYSLGHEVAI